MVALTFDDGPGVKHTGPVLDVLRRYNAHASFFVVCHMLARPKEAALTRRALAEGHQVGSHRYDHKVPSPLLSEAQFTKQLNRCDKLFAKQLGIKVTTFRFPWGQSTASQRQAVSKRGMRIYGWDYGPGDGPTHGPLSSAITAAIANGVISHSRDGAVLLLHDAPDHPNTLAALPRILSRLQAKGYDFVTVDGLAELGYKYPTQAG